ncbi:two-component sensor histidine kinase [Clostridium bovifaecis]|uniref:histidine kinase n=1 Tax=Clostridium bovifaecis TaxID=2184719 RepID=A0A6I6F0Q1_9CLOT|nr:two-component sensor histidine kinase [Clostridium bovifaecis]
MFKKLRNKFLFLNLVIISVMMMISFISIYLITYNTVRRDIDLELHKISEFNRKPKENPKELTSRDPMINLNKVEPHPERSISFTLTTDNNDIITSSFSILNMDEEFYETAKDMALSQNFDKGNFKLDDTHWAFMKIPYIGGYRIVFLDITSRQGILTNLIYTFLVAALIMLIVIFFISKFFANKSIKPIKEAFDKQKQFIGDASHELKTPLSVISTNVDVLLSNKEDSISNQSKWLYYIKSEVERMSKLTNDLLYLAQIDYSDVKMIFSDFNLSEAVENVILTMEALIFENGISLNYELEPNLVIRGNAEQVKQVIMILLDNALKYTNPKGTVDIVLKKTFNNIFLSVTNTGKGIPGESIDRIFDRFYRIDKSRSRSIGGYGLGLPIAKAIIEQHKGTISVKSVLNENTTFSIMLPISSKH